MWPLQRFISWWKLSFISASFSALSCGFRDFFQRENPWPCRRRSFANPSMTWKLDLEDSSRRAMQKFSRTLKSFHHFFPRKLAATYKSHSLSQITSWKLPKWNFIFLCVCHVADTLSTVAGYFPPLCTICYDGSTKKFTDPLFNGFLKICSKIGTKLPRSKWFTIQWFLIVVLSILMIFWSLIWNISSEYLSLKLSQINQIPLAARHFEFRSRNDDLTSTSI